MKKPRSSVVLPPPNAQSGQPDALAAYSLTIKGDPVPKGRPRVVNGHTYTDARTVNAERQVRAAWAKSGFKPIQGPVRVSLAFWRLTARPCDWDNLAKLVCDALNGLAFEDDSQIIEAYVSKGIDRENPRTDIQVEAIGGLSPVDWEKFWGDV
jgi:Holliday junction resolvase RusA-like endonuclease